MESSLKEFSARAHSLFPTLPESNFTLKVEQVRANENVEVFEEEPGPSLMSWKEVSSVSREPDDTCLPELSAAARRAFEEELEYDEFDLVATQTMDSSYSHQEHHSLNPEVIEEEEDSRILQGKVVKRRGVPRYLRYPEKYKCYTLDEPIIIGCPATNSAVSQQEVAQLQEPPERVVFTKKGSGAMETENEKMRSRPTTGPVPLVQSEAMSSFEEKEVKKNREPNSTESNSNTSKRSSRKYRKKQKDDGL